MFTVKRDIYYVIFFIYHVVVESNTNTQYIIVEKTIERSYFYITVEDQDALLSNDTDLCIQLEINEKISDSTSSHLPRAVYIN